MKDLYETESEHLRDLLKKSNEKIVAWEEYVKSTYGESEFEKAFDSVYNVAK